MLQYMAMESPNLRVYKSCVEMLYNLRCDKHIAHSFTIPFIRYVLSWPYSLPITTILIGQNPYPQDIYSDYGAALSYSESKCASPPASVNVIAHDLFNTCNVPVESTVRCFRDIWMMVEKGVICINETVFSRLLDTQTEFGSWSIKESEFQLRTIQVLISESYAMGQDSFKCIGMGVNATMMLNALRQWCPSDVISMKCMTCANPAAYARKMGDSESREVTLRNFAISKLLSSIVEEYQTMPPKRDDRRSKQNAQALQQSADSVVASSRNVHTEYANYIDRLKAMRETNGVAPTIEDMEDALGGLVAAIDNHANITRAHTMSSILAMHPPTSPYPSRVDPAPSTYAPKSPVVSPVNLVPSAASSVTSGIASTRRPARRVAQSSRLSTSTIPQKAQDAVPETIKEGIISPSTPVQLDTERRTPVRRVARRQSSATVSVAGTEYTAATKTSSKSIDRAPRGLIGRVEAVHMTSISNWLALSLKIDRTYHEMLRVSIDENVMTGDFPHKVLEYVKMRMAQNDGYDAFDELQEGDSETSRWCLSVIEAYSSK